MNPIFTYLFLHIVIYICTWKKNLFSSVVCVYEQNENKLQSAWLLSDHSFSYLVIPNVAFLQRFVPAYIMSGLLTWHSIPTQSCRSTGCSPLPNLANLTGLCGNTLHYISCCLLYMINIFHNLIKMCSVSKRVTVLYKPIIIQYRGLFVYFFLSGLQFIPAQFILYSVPSSSACRKDY